MVEAAPAGTAETLIVEPRAENAGQWEHLDGIGFMVFSIRRGDHALILSCEAGTRSRLYWTLPVGTPKSEALRLASGPYSLQPEASASDVTAPPPPVPTRGPIPVVGMEISFTLGLDEPLVRNFLRDGDLRLSWGAATLDASANSAELSSLARWRGSCR